MRNKLKWWRYKIYNWWHSRLPAWIAYKLPRNIAYWAAIRVGAAATTGQYKNQVVPELLFMDALKRWELMSHKEVTDAERSK